MQLNLEMNEGQISRNSTS